MSVSGRVVMEQSHPFDVITHPSEIWRCPSLKPPAELRSTRTVTKSPGNESFFGRIAFALNNIPIKNILFIEFSSTDRVDELFFWTTPSLDSKPVPGSRDSTRPKTVAAAEWVPFTLASWDSKTLIPRISWPPKAQKESPASVVTFGGWWNVMNPMGQKWTWDLRWGIP